MSRKMSPYEEVAVKRLANRTIGECGGNDSDGGGTHFLNADKLYITSQTKCLVYISSHDRN